MSGKDSEVSDAPEATGDAEAGKAAEEPTDAVVAEVETPEDSELASVEAEVAQAPTADAERKADLSATMAKVRTEEARDHRLKVRTRDDTEDHHATERKATPRAEAAETTMTMAEAPEDQDQLEVAPVEADTMATRRAETTSTTTDARVTLTTTERDQEETAKEVAEEADHVVVAQELLTEVAPEAEPTPSSDNDRSHEPQSPEVSLPEPLSG